MREVLRCRCFLEDNSCLFFSYANPWIRLIRQMAELAISDMRISPVMNYLHVLRIFISDGRQEERRTCVLCFLWRSSMHQHKLQIRALRGHLVLVWLAVLGVFAQKNGYHACICSFFFTDCSKNRSGTIQEPRRFHSAQPNPGNTSTPVGSSSPLQTVQGKTPILVCGENSHKGCLSVAVVLPESARGWKRECSVGRLRRIPASLVPEPLDTAAAAAGLVAPRNLAVSRRRAVLH